MKQVKSYIKVVQPSPPPPPVLVIPANEKAGTLKALADIRKLFGPKGENWIRGAEHRRVMRTIHSRTGGMMRKHFDTFCLVGGINKVDGKYENAARAAISMAIGEVTKQLEDEYAFDGTTGTIINFNDGKGSNRGWPAVKKVLSRAVQLVKAAATK